MGSTERSLTDLGAHVAGQQDAAPGAKLDHALGRARLLGADLGARPGAGSSVAPRGRARRAAWIASSLAAAILFATLLVFLRPRSPLAFEVGGGATAEAGVVGAWIAAPENADLPIRFSDGSLLRLREGGRARVAGADPDGAEVALEGGSLELSVVHREHTRWRVRVGPFLVKVVGTRFETSWDRATEQLVVALHEGAVTISGPVVGDAHTLRAGERLTVSAAQGTLQVTKIQAAAAAPTPAGSASANAAAAPRAMVPADLQDAATRPDEDDAPAAPPVDAAASANPGRAPPRSAPLAAKPQAWRELAADSRYKEALVAAEDQGFSKICATASAGDLRALADAARLAGNPGRAQEAFDALLKRFPGTPDAGYAVFMVGRNAQDQRGDYAGAAAWFTRYLREQPGGRFAEEAAGRLVEVTDKAGDGGHARQAAERYLASYPKGPHAAYARRVLGRDLGRDLSSAPTQ